MKRFIVFNADGSQSEIQAWQAKQALKLAGDKAIVAVLADYSKKEDFCINKERVFAKTVPDSCVCSAKLPDNPISVEIPQAINKQGDSIMVAARVFRCNNCGAEILAPGSLDNILGQVAMYKKMKNLI